MPTMFSWIELEDAFSDLALTAQVQQVAKSVLDQGILRRPGFFPDVQVPSVKISDITTVDFRVASTRRSWDQRGKEVHLPAPPARSLSILPIEATFGIQEEEIQDLLERTQGNNDVFRQLVAARFPDRVDNLAKANLWRMELDAFRAWALGTFSARDPQGSASDQTIDLQFDSARYVTPTAWTGGSGGTAFAQLIAEAANAQSLIGPIGGVVLPQSTYAAVRQSSQSASLAPLPLSRDDMAATIVDEIGGGTFVFGVFEDTVQEYNDGGFETTVTKVWPRQRVAFVPASGVIGNTFIAPVGRGFSLGNVGQDRQISVNGQVAFKEVTNNGRGLRVECQINALSLPREQNIYVVNAGI